MKKAVIFDIDGVLAEKSPERDYREYDKVDLDIPIKKVFELLKFYIAQTIPQYGNSQPFIDKIIFITGRKQYSRDLTLKWLDNELQKSFYSLYLNSDFPNVWEIFMRADDDHRKAAVLKKEIYETHIKGKYDVVACFDDDPEICEMYKNEGLLVFEVKR